MKTPKLMNYMLKRIPADEWARFRARVRQDQVSIRAILLLMIRGYLDGRIELRAADRSRKHDA